MSYLIAYIFFNFPSNWVLDMKGIKKGIVLGSVLTLLGTGIRVLVNYSFVFMILGQILCAIGQPFLINAPMKIATRWFMPKNVRICSFRDQWPCQFYLWQISLVQLLVFSSLRSSSRIAHQSIKMHSRTSSSICKSFNSLLQPYQLFSF